MEFNIRKAKLKDMPNIYKIDKFFEILTKCSPLDQLDPKCMNKNFDMKYYEKFIRGRNKWCYIDETNEEIIGFILFNIIKREPYYKIKEVGYLDLIYVDKKYRRKNISKLLIKQMNQIFKERKIEYTNLIVQTGNPKAIDIWKKIGYKEYRIKMYNNI